jgi:ABC-2 type transport system permease protein
MTVQERFAAIDALSFDISANSKERQHGLISAFREIVDRREMLSLLVRRDLKSRYKDSALGFIWTLIRPLTQLLIYYVVIGKFLGAERGIPDFAIYVFTGLTMYGLISEIIAGSTGSIIGNSALVKKIYLPRELFPLASLGSALFNFVIQLVILIVATIVLGAVPLDWELLYIIPSVILAIIFSTAFGLLLSAINVYLRDIQYLVEVLLLVLLWASPIVYSWDQAGAFLKGTWLLEVYTDNPITLCVLAFQRAMWINGHDAVGYPDNLLLRLIIAIIVSCGLLVVFHKVFARLQGNFAQEL